MFLNSSKRVTASQKNLDLLRNSIPYFWELRETSNIARIKSEVETFDFELISFRFAIDLL